MVKINRQFQDQHLAGSDGDHWVVLQQVERDICLLYHQLADYSYIMGDLYYGSVYALPYWEFLDVEPDDPERQAFIRQGCLIMILAMASTAIDGSGYTVQPHLAEIKKALNRCAPRDEETQRLCATVQLALDLVSEGKEETKKYVEESNWAHKQFVRGYFRKTASEFASNPYYGEVS